MDSENATAGVDCIGISRNFGIEAKAIEGEVVEANYRAGAKQINKKSCWPVYSIQIEKEAACWCAFHKNA